MGASENSTRQTAYAKLKLVLSLLMIIAGFAFIWHAASKLLQQRSMTLAAEQRERDRQLITRVNVDSLYGSSEMVYVGEDQHDGQDNIIAVFLLSPSTCPNVLLEVQRYYDLFRRSTIEGRPIRSIALFMGEDSLLNARAATVSDLRMPYAHGYPSNVFRSIATAGSSTFYQHIIFVDPTTSQVFYRSVISSLNTPEQYKKEVVAQASLAIRTKVLKSLEPSYLKAAG